MCRPNLSLLPIPEALQLLTAWLEPQLPPKIKHANEKASDAEIAAVALLQPLHKQLYFSLWWKFVKTNFCPHLPSLTQATIRLTRLVPTLETLSVKVEDLDFAVIDSQPLPVCRSKRASRCTFPEAKLGYGTQGSVFGFKLHAWTSLNGKLVQYIIRPANEHDLMAGYKLNEKWVDYGAPKLIGDKAYQDGAYLTPPKKNAITLDPRWKKEYGSARKIIESVFSSLTRAGIRFGQLKTHASLRLRVALTVMAHNMRFVNP